MDALQILADKYLLRGSGKVCYILKVRHWFSTFALKVWHNFPQKISDIIEFYGTLCNIQPATEMLNINMNTFYEDSYRIIGND